MMKRAAMIALAALALVGCKRDEAEPQADSTTTAEPAAGDPETPVAPEATGEPTGTTELDRLLAWIPNEPHAVAYDRLSRRFDPATLEVVFGIPPKAGHVLDERGTLDDALALVFEGESEASTWLAPTSFAFTIALSRSPYFLRPLSKPAAEVAPLLQSAGFTKNTIDGVELWLPSGAFPWRIALVGDAVEGQVAAFIPIDVPGAGLEPLVHGEEAPHPAKAMVEAELRRALTEDPMIELVLIASGPLTHFDVRQPIAQVQFALRRVTAGSTPTAYEGQIVLAPTSDPDECANDLRARKYPEENQQVQTLLAGVEFVVLEGAVIGRLAIPPDQLKHFLLR